MDSDERGTEGAIPARTFRPLPPGRVWQRPFKMIDQRRSEVERMQWRLFLVQLPRFLCLMLMLLPIEVRFSIFGITSDNIIALREVLLVISGVLGILARSYASQLVYLKEMINARAEKIADKNEEAKMFLRLVYGLESEWLRALQMHISLEACFRRHSRACKSFWRPVWAWH